MVFSVLGEDPLKFPLCEIISILLYA
jgi:hypothetical protein